MAHEHVDDAGARRRATSGRAAALTTGEVERMACRLLRYHGLEGWKLVWANWRGRVAARCVRPLKWVMVSKPFAICNDEAAVMEILLHEIAHALDPTPGGKHEELWRQICVGIGGGGQINLPLRTPPKRRIGKRVVETVAAQ